MVKSQGDRNQVKKEEKVELRKQERKLDPKVLMTIFLDKQQRI